MALPINRPFRDDAVYARTTSIGATPAAGSTVAIFKGNLQRAFAVSEGASTGTIAVAISINGGSTVATISFTGGANAIGSVEVSSPVAISEGDLITFTPSGGGGSTIPGHFYAVIR